MICPAEDADFAPQTLKNLSFKEFELFFVVAYGLYNFAVDWLGKLEIRTCSNIVMQQ